MRYSGILYVVSSCEVSKRLLASPLLRQGTIFVQSVDDFHPADIPDWLDGTPLLVVTESGSISRGYNDIITAIQNLPPG